MSPISSSGTSSYFPGLIKIDPTKSLLVGLKIKSPAGSYPIGFDAGPLNDGGDVLFEPTMNEWSTAHEILDNMDYNWAIQAVFGNNPNSGTVPWIEPPYRPLRLRKVNQPERCLSGRPDGTQPSRNRGGRISDIRKKMRIQNARRPHACPQGRQGCQE